MGSSAIKKCLTKRALNVLAVEHFAQRGFGFSLLRRIVFGRISGMRRERKPKDNPPHPSP